MLLLLGLTVALGQAPLLRGADTALKHGVWQPDPQLEELVKTGVPSGLAMIPLALGSLLLVVARRHDGVRHFVRGCLGCAALLFGALIGISRGAEALTKFFTSGDVSEVLNEPEFCIPLAITTLALAAGAVLLLWPPRGTNRPLVV
jgi:hypothetical protein